ncbi:hypothetical protein B0H16DRAFT_1826234 [Mycena metata]|uniref:Uncharacterized protein n=1 Tax=Mycena metata TaxID=1033252 RepID=A0AAD7GW06_9AGAR|nr:hypothetical protein B0H16DRAFT_1826234 [Mycena metata]
MPSVLGLRLQIKSTKANFNQNPGGRRFECRPTASSLPPATSLRHTLPRLRNLHLCHDTPSSVLMRYLTLPGLDTLELWNVSDNGVRRVKSIVSRSGCSVRHLSLFDTEFRQTYDCLAILPSLTSLALTNVAWDAEDFDALFDDIKSADLLPALEAMNLEECSPHVDICRLTDMLAARWNGNKGAANIKSLSLSPDYREETWMADDALSTLGKLKSKGFDLDIRSAPDWTSEENTSQMVSEIPDYGPRAESAGNHEERVIDEDLELRLAFGLPSQEDDESEEVEPEPDDRSH